MTASLGVLYAFLIQAKWIFISIYFLHDEHQEIKPSKMLHQSIITIGASITVKKNTIFLKTPKQFSIFYDSISVEKRKIVEAKIMLMLIWCVCVYKKSTLMGVY